MKKKFFVVCAVGIFMAASYNSVYTYANDTERYEIQYQNNFEQYDLTEDRSKQYKYNWLTANGIINGDVYQGNFSINRFTTKVDSNDDPSVQGTPNDSKNWVFPDRLITDESDPDYGFYGAVEDNDKKSGVFWMGAKYNLNVMKRGSNQYLQMGDFYMLGKDGQQDYTAAYLVRNGVDMSESVVWESKICFDNASDEPEAKEAEVVKLEIAEAGSLVYNDSAKASTIPVNLNAGAYAVLTFNNGDVYLGERNGHVSDKYNSEFKDEGFKLTNDSNKLESGRWYTVRYTMDNSGEVKRNSVIIKDEDGNVIINSGMRELKLDNSKAIQGSYLDKDWNARVNRSWFSFDEGKPDKGFILTVMNMADNKLGAHKNPRNKFLLDDYSVYKQSGLKVKKIDSALKFIEGSSFETEFNYELQGNSDGVENWIWLTDASGTKVNGRTSWSESDPKKLIYTLEEELMPNTYYDVHFSPEITERQGLFISSESERIKTTDSTLVEGEVRYSSTTSVNGDADLDIANLTDDTISGYVIAFIRKDGVIYKQKVYSFAVDRLDKGSISKHISQIDLPSDKSNAEFVVYLWNKEGTQAMTEPFVTKLDR